MANRKTAPKTARQTVTIPVYGGTSREFLLGSMTPEQAITFENIPGPGQYYAAHVDPIIKDGPISGFTMLMGDEAGTLTIVSVAPNGTRTR